MRTLVSCILPTGNRPGFFRQALRCFLRQTYDNSELIVVDDGTEPVEELCRGIFRVRYLRLREPNCLGTKLNYGIRHAEGDLLQKLDDDDYYHPSFLERAVAEHRRSRPEHAIVAWDCFHVLFAGDDRLIPSGHGWAAGGTLLFHRCLWERAPFRDLPSAVDHAFLADHSGALRRVCAPDLYILVRHGGNTWKTMNGGQVDDYFRQRSTKQKRLSDIVEPIDCQFYSALSCGAAV